ncbi:hypothetical protein [Xylophilus sp.]|uniref:hypothetical protein n=1 Tax=Xylophilus sp. TaxID=2653893 RepID=UPI0013B5FD55|nr:hypothetical protein [Xylophilus sp.]KAF1042938.1 MAG: hypothetical protein GAK38_04156 [Xylophilus sp.]
MNFSHHAQRVRRTFALGLCAFGLGAWTHGAWADYPDKPIRWVVGFPAGGGTDVLARTVGAQLAEQARQQVVVDNRPSAGGMLAADI